MSDRNSDTEYNLHGKKIAVLVADGFEQIELTSPVDSLKDSGAEVHIVSPNQDEVRGWDDGNWGRTFDVDVTLNAANADDYAGLMLPGGVMNPDSLRVNDAAIGFIQSFFEAGKPVAAICHAPWVLINAGAAEGRRLTSYHTIRRDLENAGAHWVDEEVVVDQGLVTSRNPDDLPAFNDKMAEEFYEGRHAEQRAQFVEA